MRLATILTLFAVCCGPLNGSTGYSEGRPCQPSLLPTRAFLLPNFQKGAILSNIFSRTNSYKGNGFDELARRISGTATYRVTASTADHVVFDLIGRYDGRPESKGTEEIKDRGRTDCYDGKCAPSLEASGVLYNPLLWGMPAGELYKGMTWRVDISQPWELGPAGEQTVTAISLDACNKTVTLEREGSGDGFFDNDSKQVPIVKDGKPYNVDVVPGHSHWIGYTTVREGVILSDELLVTRPVTLSSREVGTLPAVERQYILLNAMPLNAYPYP